MTNRMSGLAMVLSGLVLSGELPVVQAQNPPAVIKDNPIHITFVIHFDPLFAPRGQVLRQAYEAERDNLEWLADYLERLERQKGKEFVPRLTLEIGGDHAEWYLEDEKGFALLRRLYQKGIHSFGTHFHSNYKAGKHLWYDARSSGRSPQAYQRVTYDHITEVDKLIGEIIGSDDPKQIRKVNRTITGHFLDQRFAEQMGFDTLTGGRNEAMNLFFDHDVYNPFRPAVGWNLAEDLNSHWLLIPQAPVLGAIGEHAPLPPGVPEEYRRGMRMMIWQDISVPAMQRKFLHLYLEWRVTSGEWRETRHPSPVARHSPWVFGWHEHTNNLYSDETVKVPPSRAGSRLRGAVVEFVEWLNDNFVGKTVRSQARSEASAVGNATSLSLRGSLQTRLIAKYSSTDEVRDAFLAWEKAHPGQSSFNYPVQVRDWEKYPYQLKGLARELIYAHYAQEITAFKEKGVHVHKLVKTDGRNWRIRDGKVVCDGATKDIYLLWSDRGEVTVDFSGVVKGKVRRVEGKRGNESVVGAKNLVVSVESIVVEPVELRGESPVDGQARPTENHPGHEVE